MRKAEKKEGGKVEFGSRNAEVGKKKHRAEDKEQSARGKGQSAERIGVEDGKERKWEGEKVECGMRKEKAQRRGGRFWILDCGLWIVKSE